MAAAAYTVVANPFDDVSLIAYTLRISSFSCKHTVGQRYGMTVQEFGHLLHSTRLHNFKDEENVAGG